MSFCDSKAIVARLRECRVSAPDDHPVHPEICDLAANIIERYDALYRERSDEVLSLTRRYYGLIARMRNLLDEQR